MYYNVVFEDTMTKIITMRIDENLLKQFNSFAKLENRSLSKFRIFETTQFQSDLEKLPEKIKAMLENKLKVYVYPQLSKEASCGLNIKKVKNYSPSTWRYRIGNYRIFYEIDETENIVFVLSIDQRNDVY